MNWNWPEAISVGLAKVVQLLRPNETFVAARAVKTAPGVFVKLNWNDPSSSRDGFVRRIAVGAGVIIPTILEALGMPLTNTVASA